MSDIPNNIRAHPPNDDAPPLDIWAYHQRTKHRPTRYALGPAFLDWTSQPSPFRRFDGAPLLELPLCAGAETSPFPGPAPVAAPLDREGLGLFLELAFGLSAWKAFEGSTWALRNNPSSGNLHPTEAYVLLNAGPTAEHAALYHYAPAEHALEERARSATERLVPDGGFLLVLTSIPWRENWKYGERAFRYCQLDAGHAIGAAAQAAAALGWRAALLPEPSDADIAALVGLDRADAWRRREEEHPEALVWIDVGKAPIPTLDAEHLAQSPREWFGSANRLSEDHEHWPVVDRALTLCSKPRTKSEPRRATPAAQRGPAIGAVIRGRRSAQRMDGATSLPGAAFEEMLRLTSPGVEPLLSSTPLKPRLSLLLFVHRVEGLSPGLYLLSRDAEATERLRALASPSFDWAPAGSRGAPLFRLREGSCEREATKLSCLQPIAGKGCFAAAMIADFDRALAEEGAFGYRRLHWEAGLIGQSLYLSATAFGLQGTGIGCFFDDEVHDLLGFAPGETKFQDIYHFTVGAGVDDPRLLTLPAYSEDRKRHAHRDR